MPRNGYLLCFGVTTNRDLPSLMNIDSAALALSSRSASGGRGVNAMIGEVSPGAEMATCADRAMAQASPTREACAR